MMDFKKKKFAKFNFFGKLFLLNSFFDSNNNIISKIGFKTLESQVGLFW